VINKRLDAIQEYFRSFQVGEERGFEFFFRRSYAPLCQFANRLVNDRDAAEDLVQECFLNLWEKNAVIKNPLGIKSFLYTTVRNACYDFLRKEKRIEEARNELVYLAANEDKYALQEIVRAETINEIYSTLQSLPPRCREVFRMSCIEGRNHKEIAEQLGLSAKTVRNHKFRAMNLLRQKFANFILLLWLVFF
jgi:RNA polymerase sigma-70 factor (family 1)